MQMSLTVDHATGAIRIAGSMDIEAAEGLRDRLAGYLGNKPELILVLSEVEKCDVTGLQLILAARLAAARSHKGFRIAAISQAVLDTANAIGLAAAELTGNTETAASGAPREDGYAA